MTKYQEQLFLDEFIKVNCEYSGSRDGEVERTEEKKNTETPLFQDVSVFSFISRQRD